MKIDLPSGAWLELRDKLTREDQRAVQAAVEVIVTPSENGDGARATVRLPGDHQARRQIALLDRIITGWSYSDQGVPVPSQNMGGPDVIESTITDPADWAVIEDQLEPLMEKVNPPRRPNSRKPSAT